MKTVIILAGLIALTLAGTVPKYASVATKSVDTEFVQKQKKILSLIKHLVWENPAEEYYKIGKEYDIEANIDKYTNKNVVEEFLTLYRTGFLPKGQRFSVFYEKPREEAIWLYRLFYAANDFQTFYKTAAFARVHLNVGQFLYAYSIAVTHRSDTKGIVLPAAYELFPQQYVNSDIIHKLWRVKLQGGIVDSALASYYGVEKENDYYVLYANYSDSKTYSHGEQKLSYFTEDVGLNSHYYWYHAFFPFWMSGDENPVFKEKRGEVFFYFYQQILARYYMERLTNGLGEIPEFSWTKPIKTGYSPLMSYIWPWPMRNNYYVIDPEVHEQELQWLDAYEKNFLQILEKGIVTYYGQEVDLHNPKAINFVGNYWQGNVDWYGMPGQGSYDRTYSYQGLSRHLLGAASEYFDKYPVMPSALENYQTSLRDPMFYQLYSRILNFVIKYKENLKQYTQNDLHYVGVKINDVKVDKLVTFFDFFDIDVTNVVSFTTEEATDHYVIRQPRLTHNPFTVSMNIKSDVATEATVKIFLAPKYDSNGNPIRLEENWENFVELDWFITKLTVGNNQIDRNSNEFFFYKEDSIPTTEVLKLLDQGKVPTGMSEKFNFDPNRLMLPRGTNGGYPFQIFTIVYPYKALSPESADLKNFILDNRPLGWPFDRPVYNGAYFMQPNMFFKDVSIYHEGPVYPYKYNTPGYLAQKNVVPKH